jgi:hypothetical protein
MSTETPLEPTGGLDANQEEAIDRHEGKGSREVHDDEGA